MSKSKHTPGPWTYEKVSSSDGSLVYCRIWQGEDTLQLAFAGTYYHTRDRREGGPERLPASTAEANARLIASAPDLLEACKAMLKYIESDADIYQHEIPSCGPAGYCLQARAAIAKAEGLTAPPPASS